MNNTNNSNFDNQTSNNQAFEEHASQAPNNARAVIINIDDLGLSSAVNEAVIRLAERGLIGASSYMVGGTISDNEVRRLAELNVDVGLHLDLTGIFPSALLGSLKPLIITSYLRRLKPSLVTDIINRQLDAFEDTFGYAPVFVDGHQHIHQLPIIRQRLIEALDTRYSADAQNTICARVTTPLINDTKSRLIYALGGHKWRKLCQEYNIRTNDKFAGVYGFDATVKQLAVLWENWLDAAPRTKYLTPKLHTMDAQLQPLGTYSQYSGTVPSIHSVPLGLPREVKTTLLMCHPATPANDWQDDIKVAREREYEWLMSRQFEDLLHHYEVRLVKWSDIAKA